MTDLQYVDNFPVTSNSKFHYKDITSYQQDHRIKFFHETEKKIELRHNIPIHRRNTVAVKELEPETNSAFDKAEIESSKTEAWASGKYDRMLQKEKLIQQIIQNRNTLIKQAQKEEKFKLQLTLTRIIKDSLKFTKENNPMISMMPSRINSVVKQIKEDKGLNVSLGSLNLSAVSKTSERSIKKYESNEFLKALGLDLQNLHPDSIHIDIDQAFKFIKNWKISRDVNQVIRVKVVNEIMNVEERRASQKVERINKKMDEYLDKKKEREAKAKREKEIQLALEITEKQKDPRFKLKQLIEKNKSKSKSKSKKKSLSKSNTNVNVNINIQSSPEKNVPRAASSTNYRRKHHPGPEKKKKKLKLNAYSHVDKILTIIKSSDELMDNASICNHFTSIKFSKRMDDLTRKLMEQNQIITCEESDG